ncbi:hypothetical protein LOAG_10714 [Loa loa]|uniref:Uncharacterized protein n=1 Tax=Loa loa TaxID=7209 RepID=A0A1S0TPB0_LOALO|nr:hypothetical protein LOAG_10714 [Loa loa]EFO17783.1 hypothetical protein LOAG_10714 [Loa loa]
MILLTKQAVLVIDNFIAIDLFGTNSDVKYCFLSDANSYYCHKLTVSLIQIFEISSRVNDKTMEYICSSITAKLLSVISTRRKKRYRILNKWIRLLDLNIWHKMSKFRMIFIDANHAPAKEAANLLLKYNGVDNVAISVPIIGCESFLVNIFRELKYKIWLHPERFEIAQILAIDYFSERKATLIFGLAYKCLLSLDVLGFKSKKC